jgi:hypothetical protein
MPAGSCRVGGLLSIAVPKRISERFKTGAWTYLEMTFSEVNATPLARMPSPKIGRFAVRETVPRVPAIAGSTSAKTAEAWPCPGTTIWPVPKWRPPSSVNEAAS